MTRIKGWKKTKNEKYAIVFKNYVEKSTPKVKRLVGISPDFVFTNTGTKIAKWNVEIHNLEGMGLNYVLHKFKTKPKALRFARNYMFKHPKG